MKLMTLLESKEFLKMGVPSRVLWRLHTLEPNFSKKFAYIFLKCTPLPPLQFCLKK